MIRWNELDLWCHKNLLEVNASITKVMYFSSKYLNSTSKPFKKLTFNTNELEYVESYKYLGLTINSNLNFSQHMNNTLKTVAYKVLQLKNCISQTALLLYKSMILPIINYADIFYHNKNMKVIKKFQMLQNRCIRIINKMHTRTNTLNEESRFFKSSFPILSLSIFVRFQELSCKVTSFITTRPTWIPF